MISHLLDCAHLLVRWLHVIAGIMWIGDSFLFMWLDSHLQKTNPARGGEGQMVGELWMVHSGGFYEVYKRKYLRTSELPETLYWFKWESYSTWISGACLLVLVYYLGSGALLVEPGAPLAHGHAVLAGVMSIALAWIVYDALCRTALARDLRVFGAFGLVCVAAIVFGYATIFTGRAAFLHTGALLGTIMACNVFFRIIPAQKALLAATAAGATPDVSLGARAKVRSTHNHYITLPLLFTMLSNHFPALYGHALSWLVFALLCLFGVALKRIMITKGRSSPLVIAGAALAFLFVVVITAPKASVAAKPVAFGRVRQVITERCSGCHSETPKVAGILAPPKGVVLTSDAHIKSYAAQIKQQAVDTKTMPLGNLTQMSDEERALLGQWISQGASLEDR